MSEARDRQVQMSTDKQNVSQLIIFVHSFIFLTHLTPIWRSAEVRGQPNSAVFGQRQCSDYCHLFTFLLQSRIKIKKSPISGMYSKNLTDNMMAARLFQVAIQGTAARYSQRLCAVVTGNSTKSKIHGIIFIGVDESSTTAHDLITC